MSILILVDVLLKMLVFADIFLEKKIAENQFHSSSLKNIITCKILIPGGCQEENNIF